MSRPTHKQPGKTPADPPTEVLDRKIDQICGEIRDSREKLDEYIGKVNTRVSRIINSRISKFVVMHEEIVGEKNQEIKELEEDREKIKISLLNENLRKLESTITYYEEEMERVSKIKDMFKKESERFKIELDIKQKELDACKKREKQLIKQVWVLEEDIKDIYSLEEAQFRKQDRSHNLDKRKDKIHLTPASKQHTRRKPQHSKVHTEPTHMEDRDKMKSQLEDKYLNYKSNIHQGNTRLCQKLSISSQQRNPTIPHKSINHTHRDPPTQKQAQAMLSHRVEQYNIYQDLRNNLRRASKQQTPGYEQQGEKRIGAEQFRAIMLHGPTIVRQLSSVVIASYGVLKSVDESSIELLAKLFTNNNAVKVLEIMLFNYSAPAINLLQQQRDVLRTQNQYDEPSTEGLDSPTPPSRPPAHRMEHELRRKFKNAVAGRRSELGRAVGGGRG